MAWVYVGSSNGTSAVASVATTVPTGTPTQGDIWVAYFTSGQTNSAFTTPTGWTRVGTTITGNTALPGQRTFDVFWALRGAANPTLTFARTGTVSMRWGIVAFRSNRPTAGSITLQTSTQAQTAATTGTGMTAPTLTTDQNGELILLVGSSGLNAQGYAIYGAAIDPNNFTEVIDIGANTPTPRTSICAAYDVKDFLGQTGAFSATAGGASGHNLMALAFREPPAINRVVTANNLTTGVPFLEGGIQKTTVNFPTSPTLQTAALELTLPAAAHIHVFSGNHSLITTAPSLSALTSIGRTMQVSWVAFSYLMTAGSKVLAANGLTTTAPILASPTATHRLPFTANAFVNSSPVLPSIPAADLKQKHILGNATALNTAALSLTNPLFKGISGLPTPNDLLINTSPQFGVVRVTREYFSMPNAVGPNGRGNWVGHDEGTTNLHLNVNELVADDTNYIKHLAGSVTSIQLALQPITDENITHVALQVRLRSSVPDATTYIELHSLGDWVWEWSIMPPSTWTNYDLALPVSALQNIPDFTNLTLHIYAGV